MIGVLGLQGDVREHLEALQAIECPSRVVKTPADLAGLKGLILPGGESTTITMLIRSAGLEKPVHALVKSGFPVWGTCAGTILLSQGGIWASLDADVSRNAYGPQLYSSVSAADFQGQPLAMVFIRAPKLVRVGPAVEVLMRAGDEIVAARQANILVSTFHPELTGDTRFLRYFMAMVGEEREKA